MIYPDDLLTRGNTRETSRRAAGIVEKGSHYSWHDSIGYLVEKMRGCMNKTEMLRWTQGDGLSDHIIDQGSNNSSAHKDTPDARESTRVLTCEAYI